MCHSYYFHVASQRFILLGPGGIGKTTAMKHFAVRWANTGYDSFRFKFVFHVELKLVKGNQSLENIIIQQHKTLKASGVKPSDVRSLLENKSIAVLLIFDGHDEYAVGSNKDIDAVIEKDVLWPCCLILTSRESKELKSLKQYFDVEVKICGFSEESIDNYLTKVLSRNLADEFLDLAKRNRIIKPLTGKVEATDSLDSNDNFETKVQLDHGMLKIPLFLKMLCSLFSMHKDLPKTKTGTVEVIVQLILKTERIRAKKRRGHGYEVKTIEEETLVKLGKLAWDGLNSQEIKLIFSKVKF